MVNQKMVIELITEYLISKNLLETAKVLKREFWECVPSDAVVSQLELLLDELPRDFTLHTKEEDEISPEEEASEIGALMKSDLVEVNGKPHLSVEGTIPPTPASPQKSLALRMLESKYEESECSADDIGYRRIPVDGTSHDDYADTNGLDQFLALYPDEFQGDKIDERENEFRIENVDQLEAVKTQISPESQADIEALSTSIDNGCCPPPVEKREAFDGKSETEHECFDLKIVYVKNKTGFEESKDFPIKMNTVIAGRYEIREYLGSAAFSRAVQCYDFVTSRMVCIKIITNNKDFFDQSLDEIKLLKYISSNCDPEEKNVLQLYDYFYYKEHLFIVCELLRDNLYEFYKYNRDSGDELYFNMPRLKKITRQCLVALDYIHKLNLIHCDLKPENILIKSYSRCEVKVIDFGSSCYTNDVLGTYVQSRAYRAPEVILGLKYDQKIDMWSMGCIVSELWSGDVLFVSESVVALLARINSIIGPFPKFMMEQGKFTTKYYTRTTNLLYEKDSEDSTHHLYFSKRSSLQKKLKTEDEKFIDFISKLLALNPNDRPTAEEALTHPWLQSD